MDFVGFDTVFADGGVFIMIKGVVMHIAQSRNVS